MCVRRVILQDARELSSKGVTGLASREARTMKPNGTVDDNSVESYFALYPHFSSFLFFSGWTPAIAITGNKFQEVSAICKSHADYLSNFVRHRCRIFRPRITPENVTNTRHTVPPLELIPFRRVLRELSGIPKNVLSWSGNLE